jgi:peptide/nickel transport system ATP-binding protein
MIDYETSPVLEVEDLEISFGMYQKGLKKTDLCVIHSLSIEVYAGEVLAVVGSSGSGKSLLAHGVLGILPNNAKMSGSIRYFSEDFATQRQKKVRGTEVVFIPKSVDFLDPLMRVGKQVIGTLGTKEKQKQVFERYQLKPEVEKMYPFQLSGGMARRVLISTAEMQAPKLIVADEPTPGLNVEMASETLRHFRAFADDGCSVLLITHDIDQALSVSDRIAVFYAGTTVEIAQAKDFVSGSDALRHPYSRAFIDAFPQNDFRPISGSQPYAGNLPEGCLFADRCSERTGACSGNIELRSLRGGKVRCINAT